MAGTPLDLRSRRILLTGGGGFLGSHIVERLRAEGAGQLFAPRKSEYDLTDAAAMERLFQACRPEIVIHAAASVGGIGANRDNPGRFFYENAIMGVQLIEACRKHGVAKTVVLGTICAYPKFTPVPFREDDLWNGYPEETNAPYGIAKKALLVQGQAYRQQYGLNAIFLLAGQSLRPARQLRPALVARHPRADPQVRRGGRRPAPAEIVLWGDGTPTREFLYVEDAAEGIVAAARAVRRRRPGEPGHRHRDHHPRSSREDRRADRLYRRHHLGRGQAQRPAATLSGRQPRQTRVWIRSQDQL